MKQYHCPQVAEAQMKPVLLEKCVQAMPGDVEDDSELIGLIQFECFRLLRECGRNVAENQNEKRDTRGDSHRSFSRSVKNAG